MDSGVSVEIGNVPVMFPFTPYPQQIEFMKTVIAAINMKHDAVLESPTGTGKTLSLLCSSLAWLSAKKQKTVLSLNDVNFGGGGIPMVGTGPNLMPKIFYCSRTHSQLAQVIKELNTTMYRGVRCAILGGRDQLCTNVRVSKLRDNAAKTTACKALRTQHTCHAYNQWDKQTPETLDKLYYDGKIPDIEDLARIAKTNGHCAFYRSRQMADTADIVLLPYNYLLDPNLRRIHKIDLKNNIVIFDEAHNLESICEESSSSAMTTTDLAAAINDLQVAIRKRKEEDEAIRVASDDTCAIYGVNPIEKSSAVLLDLNKAAHILKALFDFEEKIIEYYKIGKELTSEYGEKIQTDGRILPGNKLIELLEDIGLGAQSIVTCDFDNVLLAARQQLTDTTALESTQGRKLEELATFVHTVLASGIDRGTPSAEVDYKLWINADQKDANGKVLQYSVNFWCFDASVSMQCLRKSGVQSIIVTSGTLAPIDAFVSRIGLNVGSVFTGEHSANINQVKTLIVEKGPGPKSRSLDGSYKHRSNPDYVTAIGDSIIRISQEVPQGMLVFFPSFAIMKSMMDVWEKEKVMAKINFSKKIVVEPREKVQMKEQQLVFDQEIVAGRGAVFFAVFKGKLAEGINFNDRHARAVVIVGIPFPPAFDTKILIKKEILNEKLCAWRGKENTDPSTKPIDSRRWYTTEAMRAVNQALGRVLRHKDDFGMVILLDTRFKSMDRSLFPSWLKTSITTAPQFDTVVNESRLFFEKHGIALRDSEKKAQNAAVEGTRVKKRPHTVIKQEMAEDCDMFSDAPLAAPVERVVKRVAPGSSALSLLAGSDDSSAVTGWNIPAGMRQTKRPPSISGPPLLGPSQGPIMPKARRLKLKPNSAPPSRVVPQAVGVTSSQPIVEEEKRGVQTAEESASVIKQMSLRIKSLGLHKSFRQILADYKSSKSVEQLTRSARKLFGSDNKEILRVLPLLVDPQQKSVCEEITSQMIR